MKKRVNDHIMLTIKRRKRIETAAIILLSAAVLGGYLLFGSRTAASASATASPTVASGATGENGLRAYIKYVNFNVPYSAMYKAMNIDIASHSGTTQLHWVEMLAYLATKYGGNWHNYKSKDMDALAAKLRKGETMANLTAGMKNYAYFYGAYDAVLGNFLGDYQIQVSDPADQNSRLYQVKYGLKVFSPIAAGYGYGHYDDFGDSRSFGFRRRHLGNDLMGTVGTPIIAVEGGIVESMGWNQYGGWRIGIRSFDRKRYYYYAHLRQNHPYALELKEGDIVHSGDVIGYLGMTGYSTKENVNNMQKPHLHFGMQLVFDESQKESNNEIWIDVYDIVNLLSQNRVRVKLDDNKKDYTRVFDFVDLRYQLYYE